MLTMRAIPAVIALLLSVAGCGTDSERGADSERRTPARAVSTTDGVAGGDPAAAYAGWVDALARHDAAAACSLQAPELTIDLRYQAILEDRAELGDPCTAFESLLWEDSAFRSEIVDISVTQITEEDALLAVALGPGKETFQTVRMVYHRAGWRVFSTEDRSERSGAGSAPARWVTAWCTLDPSMSRDEIVSAMGEPSGEYTVADGGEPQLWWAQDQYDFRVYLDPVDGSVLELVGDYDALSADDRSRLPCPELRS